MYPLTHQVPAWVGTETSRQYGHKHVSYLAGVIGLFKEDTSWDVLVWSESISLYYSDSSHSTQPYSSLLSTVLVTHHKPEHQHGEEPGGI